MGDGARVDDDDIGRGAKGHLPKTFRPQRPRQLPTVILVDLATQSSDGESESLLHRDTPIGERTMRVLFFRSDNIATFPLGRAKESRPFADKFLRAFCTLAPERANALVAELG
jgi:hypothetical protein